jgi:hypothetical protein
MVTVVMVVTTVAVMVVTTVAVTAVTVAVTGVTMPIVAVTTAIIIAVTGTMDAIGAMASAHVGDGHPMVMFGFAVTEHLLKKGLVMPAPFSIARALLCVQDALP